MTATRRLAVLCVIVVLVTSPVIAGAEADVLSAEKSDANGPQVADAKWKTDAASGGQLGFESPTIGPGYGESGAASYHPARSDPETADDYLARFREMREAPAFAEYTEFETIRSTAVSRLQVVEFTSETETEMATVLALLESFERSYAAAESGSTRESLEATNETGTHVRALEAQGRSYAPLADLALSRFYEDLGESLLAGAESTSRTPETLEGLSTAAIAFERAGAREKFSQVNLRAEALRAEYRSDRETMRDAEETATAFLESCTGCESPETAVTDPFRTFEMYGESRAALRAASDGKTAAAAHSLEDREAEFAELRASIEDARTTLAVVGVALLSGYGLLVGVLSMLVTHRLVTWRRTFDASQVGEIVVLEGGDA